MNYHHIYNRGAHKALVFHDKYDYERMLKLLYIANSSKPFVLRDFDDSNIFEVDRGDTLVNIVAYCLMPNHFHIASEMDDRDDPQRCHLRVTKFMRKLCTAYTVYYNLKYKHSGTIWQGACKNKISPDPLYFDTLISYIHLNPYTAKHDENQNSLKKEFLDAAWSHAREYEYSSLRDYSGENRLQSSIISHIGDTYVKTLAKSISPWVCIH